jgi:hypothetical protein
VNLADLENSTRLALASGDLESAAAFTELELYLETLASGANVGAVERQAAVVRRRLDRYQGPAPQLSAAPSGSIRLSADAIALVDEYEAGRQQARRLNALRAGEPFPDDDAEADPLMREARLAAAALSRGR